MSNWKRITLVVFVLIGGTMSFGYWSFYQFDTAFDDLETTLTTNTLLVFSSLKKDTKLASTSLETTLIDTKLASTSLEISKDLETPIVLEELSFNFPEKDANIYVGCTYPISWQPPATINSLEADLVDAGARKSVGPIEGSLAKENVTEADPQNLSWKVGSIWPGKYYIKVSKINDVDVEIRSEVFAINNIPKSLNTDERAKICKKSGGLL